MSESNNKLLKQLTQKTKKAPEVKAIESQKPAPQPKKDSVFKSLKNWLPGKPSGKTVLDIALFAGTVYIIYEYGKSIASLVEEAVPTEQSIMEMMQQQ